MNDYLISNNNHKIDRKEYGNSENEEEGEILANSSRVSYEDDDYENQSYVINNDLAIKSSPYSNYNEDEDDEQYALNSSSKSNRRKQSNPIRISMQEKLASAIKNSESKQIAQNQNEDHNSNSSFKQNNNSQKSLKRKLTESVDDMTSYDNEDNNEDEELLNKKQKTSSSASLSSAPNLTKFSSNIESFCTICKKEVCNKYFLKTHLANKHGIYITDDLTSTSYLTAIEQQISSQQQQQQQQQREREREREREQFEKEQQNDEQHNTSMTDSNDLAYNSTSRPSEDFCDLCEKHFCNKYYLKKHKFDVHGVCMDTNIPSSSPSATPPILTPSIQNNVKSSNKKSLDVNCTSTLSPSPSSSLTANLLHGGVNGLLGTTTGQINPAQFTSNNNTTKALMDQFQATNPFMLMNPFLSPMMNPFLAAAASSEAAVAAALASLMPQAKDSVADEMMLMQQFKNHELNSILPLIKAESNQSLTQTGVKQEEKRSSSTGTHQVMCNLCSKLFYNEEYLKLHKLNKHGKSQESSVAIAASSSKTRLPIKLAEQTANNKENYKNQTNEPSNELQQQQQQQQSLSKSTSSIVLSNSTSSQNVYNETFCEYCNKTFCNKYFLKTHMLRSHGKEVNIHASVSTANDLIQNQNESYDNNDNNSESNLSLSMTESGVSENNGGGGAVGNGNNGVANVVDRVQCDICQKYICNKYFLKTHKQKVHGIIDSSNGTGDEQQFNDDPQQHNEYQQSDDDAKTTPQTIVRDSYCELCKRQFCSKYFLKNHMINMHRISTATTTTSTSPPAQQQQQQQLKENENKKCQTSSVASSSSASSTVSSCAASTISTASTKNNSIQNNEQRRSVSPSTALFNSFETTKPACLICNKTLCNKYFLKSHLTNAHQLTFEKYMEKYSSQESLTNKTIKFQHHQTTTKNLSYLNLRKKFIKNLNKPKLKLSFKLPSRQRENATRNCGDDDEVMNQTDRIKNESAIDDDEQENSKSGKINKKDVKMQKFLLDSNDNEFLNNFIPCMIYLPMKNLKKLTKPLNLSLTLMPIDANTTTTTSSNDIIITNGFLNYDDEED